MQKLKYAFMPNPKYDGIRPISIYLMRAIYGLMFFVLGKDVWSKILFHEGAWGSKDAMVWCVWAAFSSLALIGIFRTVRMLPILLLEIFYKVLWLAIVVLPLVRSGQTISPEVTDMMQAFLWVALPIIAVPWGYVVNRYLLGRTAN
ncbi:hypothetical protein PVT67_10045 [Gallaecimonas kandeliae]|uniref:hypothetical protein n=1 Tax=Gallaecimonas kandeliae TaxID=3029055 RepID=UPI0026480A90|nr:hypothetical protein [Gallaecimonas kandeliae]WKE64041.1 hypothetical protein PVT67_10045 [Gallaecimonas kandeliae]